jgi:hypothetical protein
MRQTGKDKEVTNLIKRVSESQFEPYIQLLRITSRLLELTTLTVEKQVKKFFTFVKTRVSALCS